MSDTPRTDNIYDQFGPVLHPAVMAYNSLCRELERENAELRERLSDLTKRKEDPLSGENPI